MDSTIVPKPVLIGTVIGTHEERAVADGGAPRERGANPTAHKEERTSTHWDDDVQMDWAQMMIFYAVGLGLWSNYNEDGAPNDGMKPCPTDAEPSSYYGEGPYDYVSGLADRFHDVVHASKQPLWNSCTQSQLTTVSEEVDKRLEFTVEKIDACKNGCMLYWNDDIDLDYCKFCGEVRCMEVFDRAYPNFAAEPRNVRLDLCTNGFVPHGQYWHTYSCWPVILTPYNLPPRMCMSYEYMFLTMVIYGPSNSKRLIDVYLEPLIEEL
ncbi:UNVERIFIED_CONTAM: hypothetical protein Scaly_3137000 [Sesamum calycinum]|uniref:Uncharacterized protein n=1 Tax=Sesamum calycinum TaxID=2727403 RepID=A0AAW2JH11_9LAMI